MLEAGKLDRRITIERATIARDEFNEAEKMWSPLATVWAEKLEVSDAERVAAQEVGAELTTRFRIRYSSLTADISPLDRCTYGGRTYQITGVKELGRREGVELTTTARAE